MINRNMLQQLKEEKKSVLLLGPRQTGKSTLIEQLDVDLSINLAHQQTFFDFSRNPSELEQRMARIPKVKKIFIDEVQLLPSILNTIQVLIDKSKGKLQFFLTGSSARKLRRGQANLLPGRIHIYKLGPLVASELNYKMDEEIIFSHGALPGIYTEDDPKFRERTLNAYSATYLKEEIQAEALTKDIEGFSRFLSIVATTSGEFLDLSKLGSEAGFSPQKAKRFFEILEDTLVVKRANAFSKNARKRLVMHPRFFVFDVGIINAIERNFTASPDRKGRLFENFFFSQLIHSAESNGEEIQISSYRTSNGAEVDFIVEWNKEVWAIELKASANVGKSDLTGFQSFADYYRKPFRSVVAYLGKTEKRIDGVDVLPWQLALKEMKL